MIKELVQEIVKQFVNKPDQVVVEIVQNGDITLVEISVDEKDRGKVIGRSGQTIKALRMLIQSISPSDKKITVDIAK